MTLFLTLMLGCPPGYVQVNGKCYYENQLRLTQAAAKDICERESWSAPVTLATIKDLYAQSLIRGLTYRYLV